MVQLVFLILIHWIVICLLDSAIQLLNNWGQYINLCSVGRGVSKGKTTKNLQGPDFKKKTFWQLV